MRVKSNGNAIRRPAFPKVTTASTEFNMKNRMKTALASIVLMAGLSVSAAHADSCSHHNHTTGTVIGALGGGVIGSAVSHGSLGGVLAGATVGGLAGNAVARDSDCHHRHYVRHSRYYDRRSRRLASH